MGCRFSQPEFLINEELNDLCEKIGNSCLKDDVVEAMALSSLRAISDDVRRSFNLPMSVLKQFQFIRDFIRVSRKNSYTARLQKQFDEVEQLIRMKTWGCGGEDIFSTPMKSSWAKENYCGSTCQSRDTDRPRHHKSFVCTDELPSVRLEHCNLHTNTRSISLSFCDLEKGVPANCAVTPVSSRRKDRGASIDSYATDATCSTSSRLKSLYVCPGSCCSQETLGDFGFFDDMEVLSQF